MRRQPEVDAHHDLGHYVFFFLVGSSYLFLALAVVFLSKSTILARQKRMEKSNELNKEAERDVLDSKRESIK